MTGKSWASSERGFRLGEAGDVPARPVEPRDDAAGHGIGHASKDDRDRPRLLLDGNGRGGHVCHDDLGLQADQFLRERSHPNDVTAVQPKVNRHVAVQPEPASACVNAERRGFHAGSFSSNDRSAPIRRIRSPCCACAASGHAAAPPSPAMNSRLFIR